MEMNWRQRRTVTILTAILLILLAAVLIVLGIRYRESRQDDVQADPAALADTSAALNAYSALTYSNGSATLSFAIGEDGSWHWDNDPAFPMKQDTVNAILALVSGWSPQQTLAAGEDLSTYGLNEPIGSLTLSGESGVLRSLSFGKTTTDGTSRYVMDQSDPSTVYIIADTLFSYMGVPIYDMCELPVLPVLEESSIHSILLLGPEHEDDTPALITILTTARRNGDDGPVTWLQNGENVTSNEMVRALLEDIHALSLTKCVDYDPSDEAASICGFDTPPATLTVNYTSASGTDETLSLTVGTTLLDGSGRYVRLGDSTAIYALPTAALDPMMRIAVNGLDLTE